MRDEKIIHSGKSRRSGIRIMGELIGLVKPLLPVMALAIILGTIGYLCAISLRSRRRMG